MDIHHHMPDEVVDTETTLTSQKDVEIPSVILEPAREPVAIQYSRATCPKRFDGSHYPRTLLTLLEGSSLTAISPNQSTASRGSRSGAEAPR